MLEANKRQCKKCGLLKDRISDGKFNQKDKRWRDETGKLWNGSCCPSCNQERVKTSMKFSRSKV